MEDNMDGKNPGETKEPQRAQEGAADLPAARPTRPKMRSNTRKCEP
jgi:hypothetical protein